MDYWIGCDMGSHVDYSALSVLERSMMINALTGHPARNTRGDLLYRWRLRGLYRWPLRTAYPVVARGIAAIAALPQFRSPPRVVCDNTGVGIAVTEQGRTACSSITGVEVWACSITAGEGWRVVRKHELNVSKVQIVGEFKAVLSSGRFKVSKRRDRTGTRPIPGWDVLQRELRAFRAKITASQNEVFGAESGKHDDAVSSCSLPVWLGSLPYMQMRESPESPDDPRFYPRESAAVASEVETIEAAEQTAAAAEKLAEKKRKHREFWDLDNPIWWQ